MILLSNLQLVIKGDLYTPTLDHRATLGMNATQKDIGNQIKRYYSRGKAIPQTRSNDISNEVANELIRFWNRSQELMHDHPTKVGPSYFFLSDSVCLIFDLIFSQDSHITSYGHIISTIQWHKADSQSIVSLVLTKLAHLFLPSNQRPLQPLQALQALNHLPHQELVSHLV